MNTHPKVSVLIPAYNVEAWVEESISSILKQSYENLEIVIIDDCSTDKTYEVITKFACEDKRIIPLKNCVNKKIVDTLNYGLQYCSGDYILRHDADDVSEPNRIAEQLKYLLENNLDLVGTQMIPINSDGEIIGPQSGLPITHNLITKVANFSSPLTHVWICKTQIYKHLNGYRKVPYAEDFDFVLRAIDYGYICGNTPVALTRIRHRNGNTNDVASLAQRKGYFYALKLHRERLKYTKDSYSEHDYDRLIVHNPMIERLHSFSTKMLHKAFKSSTKTGVLYYTFLSILTSYYNLQYVFQRIKVRLMLRNSKGM
ncbi:TPA: glycosyltransferase family 2 protein [Citrobacter amalonaticus]|uniref:glycosyltransferase family 2 protein n=1 Tax=Citrobacter amalonaticus TaxID=35703 RepID=UPI00388D20E3|nr:glycosyltransferase family 2 protein [Citrobacter amalonaticus]